MGGGDIDILIVDCSDIFNLSTHSNHFSLINTCLDLYWSAHQPNIPPSLIYKINLNSLWEEPVELIYGKYGRLSTDTNSINILRDHWFLLPACFLTDVNQVPLSLGVRQLTHEQSLFCCSFHLHPLVGFTVFVIASTGSVVRSGASILCLHLCHPLLPEFLWSHWVHYSYLHSPPEDTAGVQKGQIYSMKLYWYCFS